MLRPDTVSLASRKRVSRRSQHLDGPGVSRDRDKLTGSLDVGRLEELMGETWQVSEDYEATTVAGLVSETAGRIPSAGEVIEDEHLRFEVLASTDRRIERVRVSKRANA